MEATNSEIADRRAIAVIEANILELKWLAAATRFEIALHRHDRALKYGFNSDQPRVPSGNPDGGQWTEEDGGSSAQGRTRLAGEIPTGDTPELPRERPPTSQQRSAALKLRRDCLVDLADPSVRSSRLARGLLNIRLLLRPTTTRQNHWKNYSKPFQAPRLVMISIISSSKRRLSLTVIQEK